MELPAAAATTVDSLHPPASCGMWKAVEKTK